MFQVVWRISDTSSTKLVPNPPHYLLMAQQQAYREEYEAGWGAGQIFPLNTVGVVTARDALTIQFTEEKSRQIVEDFKKLSVPVAREKYQLGPDARDWKVDLAQTDLQGTKGQYTSLMYRPFDTRYTYYTGTSRGFHCMPRSEVVQHMLAGSNLALAFTRSTSPGQSYDHVFATRFAMLGRFFVDSACITYFAPLWLYAKKGTLEVNEGPRPNLAPAFVAEVKERIGETPTPEDIFSYAYAVFHAPTYRTRYAAFLKTDFPRLPLPPDAETFHALAALGAKLTALHLLEAPELNAPGIGFPEPGSHRVKKMKPSVRYVPPTAGGTAGRVKLNDAEHFENVPPEAWEFRVGGYQPAAKWLEDRAERALTEDDITHYRCMIAAMRDTAALLPAVDAAFLELLAKNTEHLAEAPNEE